MNLNPISCRPCESRRKLGKEFRTNLKLPTHSSTAPSAKETQFVNNKLTFIGQLIGLIAAFGAFATTVQSASQSASRPNIVFIMIDDLGWMDLACQGNKQVETPNIDRLAAQGMRFTDNYAAAPVCSPTRAAIMTGKAPARLRITNHLPDQKRFTPKDAVLLPAACNDHLPLEEITVAEILKQAGYSTAFIGKWHLSQRGNTKFQPEHQGFDLNVGGCDFGGPPTFFDPYRIPTIANRNEGEYLPDRLADESIAFMKENRDKPFFLCLWNYTVHWPMEAPAALIEKYKDRTGPGLNDTRYGAMIEAMDRSIGKILSQIDALSLGDNTLVIFTSDNGAFGGVGDNRPLRKEKGYLYEGGIRVPLIVRWPGVAKSASLCHEPTISMDFFATLLDAANVDDALSQKQDGESLLPLLRGESSLGRDAIYFHYPNYAFHQGNRLGSAVRAGDFKLINYFDDGSSELYNVTKDIGETHNLATMMPEKTSKLQGMLQSWRKETAAALPTRQPGKN